MFNYPKLEILIYDKIKLKTRKYQKGQRAMSYLYIKKDTGGNSLVVQLLGLSAFTAVTWVQSLVGN